MVPEDAEVTGDAEEAAGAAETDAGGDRIGERLRKLYQDVASEPVPDAFMKLLESADERRNDED